MNDFRAKTNKNLKSPIIVFYSFKDISRNSESVIFLPFSNLRSKKSFQSILFKWDLVNNEGGNYHCPTKEGIWYVHAVNQYQ